jgi:hypothetical protein
LQSNEEARPYSRFSGPAFNDITGAYKRQNSDPGNRSADPEAAHGRAYANLPPPIVNTDDNDITSETRSLGRV